MSAAVTAQDPNLLRQINGGQHFGYAVAGAGDVNRDGYADYVVGRPSGAGSATVYSGMDGSVIWSYVGGKADDLLGWSVSSAGDVNGDGYADVAASAYNRFNGGNDAGAVYVISGRTGDVIWSVLGDATKWHWGSRLAPAGDVNADGHDDLLVGSPHARPNGTSSGMVRVYSGLDGSVLYEFAGATSYTEVGSGISSAGDINFDGHADFIIGAQSDDIVSNGRGSATVYSGADGSVLFRKDGAVDFDFMGSAVSGGYDANGDGVPDFLVGTKLSDTFEDSSGRVQVYSGVDGSELWRVDGPYYFNYFGDRATFGGDMDGDGCDDVLVGDPRGGYDGDINDSGEGWVWIYSGADGALISRLESLGYGDRMGQAVAPVGDTNGDGREDFIVGAPANGFGSSGVGYIRVYGSATAYGELLLAVPGTLNGGDFAINFVLGATPNQPVSIYFGSGFGRSYLPGVGTLDVVNAEHFLTQVASNAGAARIGVYIPPHRVGDGFWIQAIDALGRVSAATYRQIQ